MTTDHDEIHAHIAALWPARWAKANDPALTKRGKARKRLRDAYIGMQQLAVFKAAHPTARCGNCAKFKRMPLDSKGRSHCEADSDFHGYTIADRNGICTRWSGAPLPPPPAAASGD